MERFDARRLLLALIISGFVAFVSVVWFPNWLSVGFVGLLVLFAVAFYGVTGFFANFIKAYSKDHPVRVSHGQIVEETKLSAPPPKLYREHPTPKEIREALRIVPENLALLQQKSLEESTIQSYLGLNVRWNLTLSSLTPEGGKVEALLLADYREGSFDYTVISLMLDLAKYPELKVVKRGCHVWARGTIERVSTNIGMDLIELKDAEIELVETA